MVQKAKKIGRVNLKALAFMTETYEQLLTVENVCKPSGKKETRHPGVNYSTSPTHCQTPS
jgi:hypothetical protein